jgi:two-component system chemotaxis response regulator CheY
MNPIRESAMPGETILIVDDDPICLTLASIALRHAGYSILSAGDGLEALELLESVEPDLILSDIQMPHLDGFEFARHARKIKRLAGVPMIALTGLGGPDVEQRIYEAGFTAYMNKPITSVGLVARARRHLSRPSTSTAA